tara:strand:+ start:49468 stop:50445 length:978 start_codon:yes stop_codon:yes gene_type:complete
MISTQLLDASSSRDIALAKQILQRGGLVAVPTETVYGLAANAMDPVAVKSIFAAKGRPSDHPLIVHIAGPDNLLDWAVDIPPVAYQLAASFWPGPLTMLLHKSPRVPAEVTAGRETIGLRVPANPVLLALLKDLEFGVAAPSANPYKRLSPTSAAQVFAQMSGRIDAVLDGGDCKVGLESTILDLTGSQLRILRAGPITATAITQCTGLPVSQPLQHDMAVPGNVAEHYRPNTPLHLGTREQIEAASKVKGRRIACLFYAEDANAPDAAQTVIMPKNKALYAQRLYKTLYSLDGLGLDAIWIEYPPTDEQWRDVNDRLARAAAIP